MGKPHIRSIVVLNPLNYLIYFFWGLACFDMLRSYLKLSIINTFFSLKEVFCLILLLSFFLLKKRTNKIVFYNAILLVLYLFFSAFRGDTVLPFAIYLKYIIVYLTSLIIMFHIDFKFKLRLVRIAVNMFFIYSIISIIFWFIDPLASVREGRISGTTNPSFLSYIYLLIAIYCYFNNRKAISLWFVLCGLLTLTKTFIVVVIILAVILLIVERKKGAFIVVGLCIFIVFQFLLKQNKFLYIAYDRAIKVLIYRDKREYNSLDDRMSRKTFFLRENDDFNPIIGTGAGLASSASVFLREKMDINVRESMNFENQYLNIYYSTGFIGLLLHFLTFIVFSFCIFAKKVKFKDKLPFILFLTSFLLFNVTLNIIEGFSSIIFSVFFLSFFSDGISNKQLENETGHRL